MRVRGGDCCSVASSKRRIDNGLMSGTGIFALCQIAGTKRANVGSRSQTARAFTNPGNTPLGFAGLDQWAGAGSLKNGDRRFALHLQRAAVRFGTGPAIPDRGDEHDTCGSIRAWFSRDRVSVPAPMGQVFAARGRGTKREGIARSTA